MIEIVSSNDRYALEQYIQNKAKELDVEPIMFEANQKSFSLLDVHFEVISLDIFKPNKLIVVKEALFLSSKEKLSKEDEVTFNKILEQSNDVCVLFTLMNLKFDKKKKAVKKSKETGKLVVLEEVTPASIRQLLLAANKKYDLQLSNQALNKIEQYCPNLDAAHKAIDKLKLVQGQVSDDLVDLLIEDQSDIVIFELSNAIIEKDMKETFRLIEMMKLKNIDMSGVIHIFAGKIRQIYQSMVLAKYGYQQNDIASMMKISPNYAWVLMNKLNRHFRSSECLEILKSCAQFDRQSKTYMVDKKLEFELWLINYWRKYGKSKRVI